MVSDFVADERKKLEKGTLPCRREDTSKRKKTRESNNQSLLPKCANCERKKTMGLKIE